MCDICGCGEVKDKEKKIIDVNQSLLNSNKHIASVNREHFNKHGVFAVNLISSPGSGKTSLLEKSIDILGREIGIGVIEGDIETELDTERIRQKNVPVVQLTTGGACHLDSSLIHKGFHNLEHQFGDKPIDLLFIENVGNLVCPSFFDLGEHMRVVLISVPEGPDKPLKYPKAFRTSHAFIITKADLLPYFDFDIKSVIKHALTINPSLKVFVTSAKKGDGLHEWCKFIKEATGKNHHVKD
jgi:hydrogenase nickel incorporation protein HypB